MTSRSNESISADQKEGGDSGPRDDSQFRPFVEKMKSEGLPDALIKSFRHYYQRLAEGQTGYIPSSEALPIESLPRFDELETFQEQGEQALQSLVVIKLNGGLGTSMGMEMPKSLIEVKEGLHFLDIIAEQLIHLRSTKNARIPLILMNSFNTDAQSLEALEAYPQLKQEVPLSFLQHKIPKVWADDLSPAHWPEEPEKEWCPPGHGDIYLALQTSGILDRLLESGYEYAFVSNSDNLGATVSTEILGYIASRSLPFLMEVTRRTPADRKGGHLARRPDGGLLLREIAQCPPDEEDLFQDIERYRFFNTNNLWVHLPSLKEHLDRHGGRFDLPMIRNEKPVDPSQPDSPTVFQVETAMGLAIGSFEDAQAVEVERDRFLPVKRTTDLLALWSDAFILQEDRTIVLHHERSPGGSLPEGVPLVELDDRYYKLFQEMRRRFPEGAPSLRRAGTLRVTGNIFFSENVTIEGNVTLAGGDEPLHLPEGLRICGS